MCEDLRLKTCASISYVGTKGVEEELTFFLEKSIVPAGWRLMNSTQIELHGTASIIYIRHRI